MSEAKSDNKLIYFNRQMREQWREILSACITEQFAVSTTNAVEHPRVVDEERIRASRLEHDQEFQAELVRKSSERNVLESASRSTAF